jgi:hypothetical protein
MQQQLLARGWSPGRIAALLESEPEPEAQPAALAPDQQQLLRGGTRRRNTAAVVVSPRGGRPRRPREPEPEPEPELQIGLDLGPRARRRALIAAGIDPHARPSAASAAATAAARRRDRAAMRRAAPPGARPPVSDENRPKPPAGTRRAQRLTRASVYLRIRPLAQSGGHADADADADADTTAATGAAADGDAASQDSGGGGGTPAAAAVRKQLECWDDTSVTIATEYMFSTGEAEYRFPKKVFGPEVDQDGVWRGAGGPELVGHFTRFGGHNVIYFAYGQTGAGKTHTMLGTDVSLLSPVFDPGWGIFPRACAAVFETMARASRPYLLTASAVEFYMCQCLDLLDAAGSDAPPLQVDGTTHAVAGAKRVALSGVADLLPFLAQVQTNRTTRSTAMNRAEGEHGGSSRSHAALILRLTQLDEAREHVCTTSFTLMDLAGAERPSKTHEKRFSGGEMLKFLLESQGTTKPGGGRVGDPLNRPTKIVEIPTGCQALVINTELHGVGAEVLRATERHLKGQPYQPPKQLITPAVKFLAACFDGTAMCHMMVCVSSAGRNGWETWFSLQYGTDLAGLRAPIRPVATEPFERACAAAAREARLARGELEESAKNK